MKIINPYEPPQSSEPSPGIRHCFVEWLRGLLRREGWCSFCRKNYRQAGPLVEGVNRVYICHACSVLSTSIIEAHCLRQGKPVPTPP